MTKPGMAPVASSTVPAAPLVVTMRALAGMMTAEEMLNTLQGSVMGD